MTEPDSTPAPEEAPVEAPVEAVQEEAPAEPALAADDACEAVLEGGVETNVPAFRNIDPATGVL
ncbi:MAG: hypothetical protein ACXVYY_01270 [Oryzihumus sp.]